MDRRSLLLILLLACGTPLTFCSADDAPPAAGKLSPPAAAETQHAIEKIREVFKSDLAAAKKSDQKISVAKKIDLAGVEEKEDHVSQYALFLMARDLRVEAGDIPGAMEAIAQLDRTFSIDALAMQSAALTQLSKNPSVRSPKELIDRIAPIIEQSIAADRYTLARQMGELDVTIAKRGNDAPQIAELTRRSKEISAMEQAYREASKAIQVLAKTPDDADANLKVGRFRCFSKGDWETGLPLLAHGDDPALAALAKRDLDASLTNAQRLAVADEWWELAERQPAGARKQMRQRASTNYQATVEQLVGLEKTKAQRRIAEVPAAPFKASGEPKIAGNYRIVSKQGDLLLSINGANQVQGEIAVVWTRADTAELQWTIEPTREGFKIINRNSGLALAIREGSKEAHKDAIQWGFAGWSEQFWIIKAVDAKTFTIANKGSGLFLTASGKGQNVYQEVRQDSDAQLWSFEAVPAAP